MKVLAKLFGGIIILFVISLVGMNIYVNNIYQSKDKGSISFKELTELSKKVKDDRINVLVLGVDNLNAKDNHHNMRTDTMMVLSIDPITKTGFILSIPRDTRTKIDGYKYVYNKINASYSIGGINLTLKTVKDLLNIPIHHFVEVDYQALAKTVDDIGGVEVDVPMDMSYDDPYAVPPLHINLKKGLQVLDGQKAMHFLRFRHGYADQDLGRIKSQQQFMNSFIKKTLSVDSIKQIPSYIDTFYKYIQTDMSIGDMFQIVSKTLDMKAHNIKRETLAGEPKFMKGTSYYIADEEKMRAQISQLISGKYYKEKEEDAISTNKKEENSENNVLFSKEKNQISSKTKNVNAKETTKSEKPSKPKTFIVVLNGIGKSGLAQRAKDLMYVNNYTVDNTANADKFDYKKTQIYYKDNVTMAEEIQKILGAGELVQENKAYYGKATDVLVVLGEDFVK